MRLPDFTATTHEKFTRNPGDDPSEDIHVIHHPIPIKFTSKEFPAGPFARRKEWTTNPIPRKTHLNRGTSL